MLAGAGSDGFDYHDAGVGRCAGSHAQREARIQGRRFREFAPGWETREATGTGGVADACGRGATKGDAADEDAGRDL